MPMGPNKEEKMKEASKIRIVNKTGMGNDTKVFAVGENGEEIELLRCRKVTLDPICVNGFVVANIEFTTVEFDTIATLPENE
ncbi:hypothetical protein LCGC14_1916060 [marine sediment metagenome]|uniref:Uncharacterized protein n=1 Tax=marine sediment metagenome TaxID=412755 RepID=A0A0F9GFK2_9ZZZZ